MRHVQMLRLVPLVSAGCSILALALKSGSDPALSLFMLGLVSVATGVAAFIIDGGARFTPAGVFFFATAVFLGVAMMYLAQLGSRSETSTVLLAGAVSHAAVLVTMMIYARRLRVADTRGQRFWRPTVFHRSQLVLLGAALLLAWLVLTELNLVVALARAMGLAGLALLTAVFVTTSPVEGKRLGVLDRLIPLLLVVAYLLRSFSGSGRLVVTGVLLMFAYSIGVSRPSTALKPLVAVALIPGLVWAGTTFSTTSESEVLLQGEGLGSLYGPLDSLAETRERELSPSRDAVPRQYGATFWATAVIWVPREVWDSKPLGWGAVLAETLSPRYRDAGHSDASLIVGEFYANFGLAGIALLPVAMAVFLGFLRRSQDKLVLLPRLSQRQVLQWAALLACVASLADLFWGGTFSWASRGGLAAGLLLVLSRLFPSGSPDESRGTPFPDSAGLQTNR